MTPFHHTQFSSNAPAIARPTSQTTPLNRKWGLRGGILMADKQTARLCYQIVKGHFGPATAKVAEALLSRGRLPFPQIVRFTLLPPRQVRLAILILIQHNIIWHSEQDLEGEVLEINWEEALARLRFGRYVSLANDVLGERSAEIVSALLDHGKLRIDQVLDVLDEGDAKKRQIYSSTFQNLVESKHLKPSTILSHKSPRDRFLQYEEEGKKLRRGTTKGSILMPKDLLEIRVDAATRIQREEEEAEATGMIKRPRDIVNSKGKRKRPEPEDDEMVVNPEIYFKVNYPKFNVYIRNQIIVEAAASRFNSQTAEVLRAALKATVNKQPNLLDIRSDAITPHLISVNLNPEISLDHGLHAPSKSSKRQPAGIKDYISKLCCEDNTTPAGVAGAFMAPVGGGSTSKVTVEFDVIGRRLKVRVFESVVRERFGDEALRVVRILQDKGKMDEKHLAKVALMAHSQLRPLLTRLSTASLVSLQEVPKSADRNPARTFYLWYIDLPKAYSNLLSSLYQTIANIIAREQDEQERVRPVLEKRDRSDVAGDERLLGRAEVAALREWEEKQERLNILAIRAEEAVFILRDMIGNT